MSNCINGRAPKLYGDGYVLYVISRNEDGLYLEITDATDAEGNPIKDGTTSRPTVLLLALFDRIVEASEQDGVFRSKDLRDIIPGDNNNDPAFVVAVLKDIRFVEDAEEDHRYRLRRRQAE